MKSALTMNPCSTNRTHLLFQSDDRLYFLPSKSTFKHVLPDQSDGASVVAQWMTIKAPLNYIAEYWPIKITCTDESGDCLAIAGRKGFAHYTVSTLKWRLFANQNQEREITCQSMCWWHDLLIVGCKNLSSQGDEIRIYSKQGNLDNSTCLLAVEKCSRPVVLLNTCELGLLAYTSDRMLTLYSLEKTSETKGKPTVIISKRHTMGLTELCIHPSSVIAFSVAQLGVEADPEKHFSLLLNVSGKLSVTQLNVMTSNVEELLVSPPTLLSTSVEQFWLPPTSLRKQHHNLAEAVFLSCGGSGLKVWLPLYGDDASPTIPRPVVKRIILSFPASFIPLTVRFEDAMLFGAFHDVSFDTMTSKAPFPFYVFEHKSQSTLHHILGQLIKRGLDRLAMQLASNFRELPYFSHALELMLHEVLEDEAGTMTAFNTDAVLPRVVNFLSRFPQFLEVVVHCARKTEVAMWEYLFSIVGNARDLFIQCLNEGRLATAASYLIILQSLEPPSDSKLYATQLFDASLDQSQWELCKDLIRFLGAIAEDERADSRLLKPSPSNESVDIRHANNDKAFLELKLSRHAKRLLRTHRLRLLKKFSYHLNFNLSKWLLRERTRAALLDDFATALVAVHEQFNWPFPSTSVVKIANQSFSTDKFKSNSNSTEVTPLSTPLTTKFDDSVFSTTNSTNGIGNDNISNNNNSTPTGVTLFSTVNGNLNTNGTSGDGSGDGNHSPKRLRSASTGSNTSVSSSSATDQNSVLGLMYPQHIGSEDLKELKYYLNLFSDTRCYEWGMVIAIVLLDLPKLSTLIFEALSDPDMSTLATERVRNHVNSLISSEICSSYREVQPLMKLLLAAVEGRRHSCFAVRFE